MNTIKDERDALHKRLAAERSRKQSLDEQLQRYADSDPEVVQEQGELTASVRGKHWRMGESTRAM